MAIESTSSHPTAFIALRNGLHRVAEIIASVSTVMACAREAERLLQLSDAELAAKGLIRASGNRLAPGRIP